MPKGTDLSDASQTWLNDVANSMNNRPRKTLGWRTPAEAMADEIAAFKSTVTLDVESANCPHGRVESQSAAPHHCLSTSCASCHYADYFVGLRARCPAHSEMFGQFRAQHPLHQANLELLHQALIAQQIIRVLNAAQQLV